MLHRRPEVDVEYGEEEQAVDDQGDEDESPGSLRLSRADHMITVRYSIACMYSALYLQYLSVFLTYKSRSANSTHVYTWL